jgi:hypothetical protein
MRYELDSYIPEDGILHCGKYKRLKLGGGHVYDRSGV